MIPLSLSPFHPYLHPTSNAWETMLALPSEYPESATNYSNNCHQILRVVLEPIYLALISSNLISYSAAAFSLSSSHSGRTVGSKANSLSFKCCHLSNTYSSDLLIQLHNPPPYTHPDHSLFCSFSCYLLAYLFFAFIAHLPPSPQNRSSSEAGIWSLVH